MFPQNKEAFRQVWMLPPEVQAAEEKAYLAGIMSSLGLPADTPTELLGDWQISPGDIYNSEFGAVVRRDANGNVVGVVMSSEMD